MRFIYVADRSNSLSRHFHYCLYHLANAVMYFMYFCLTHVSWGCNNLVLLVHMDFVLTVKEFTLTFWNRIKSQTTQTCPWFMLIDIEIWIIVGVGEKVTKGREGGEGGCQVIMLDWPGLGFFQSLSLRACYYTPLWCFIQQILFLSNSKQLCQQPVCAELL